MFTVHAYGFEDNGAEIRWLAEEFDNPRDAGDYARYLERDVELRNVRIEERE